MSPLRRNEIGWNERFRRCLYFFLRDELDSVLVTESLIESYKTFKGKKVTTLSLRCGNSNPGLRFTDLSFQINDISS